MNRFALRIKVQEAELKIRFDRRLDGKSQYSCDPCDIETAFPWEDGNVIKDFWRMAQVVTLEFRSYTIDAVIHSWSVTADSCWVRWRAVGQMVAL